MGGLEGMGCVSLKTAEVQFVCGCMCPCVCCCVPGLFMCRYPLGVGVGLSVDLSMY